MGVFNNWEYNAEEEAARRAALMEDFLASDGSHLVLDYDDKPEPERRDCADCIYPERKCSECINKAQSTIETTIENMDFAKTEMRIIASLPTVKIEKSSGGGSSYSADCPSCGQTKILSSELYSMSAVCNKCYCTFNLEN